MIDASLAAAIAAAPAGPGAEPAPADGFGDLLGHLLAATTAAMEQVAAATLSVAADPATPPAGTGTGRAGDTPATGVGTETAAVNAEQAVAVTLGALSTARSATRTGAAAPGRKDQDVAVPGARAADGAGTTQELPEQARDGKAASAAWHAAESARAQAPGLSAVALAAADAGSPVTVPAGNAADGAAKGAVGTGLDAPATPASAATQPERRDMRAEARMEAPPAAEHAQAATGQGGVEQALADVAAPRPAGAERPRAQGTEAHASVSGIDGAPSQAGESAAAATEAAQAGPSTELFASGALRRVLEAVEAAEHRPPPNTMAVDIPGEGADDALRLMVTVRGTTVEVSTQGERGLPPGWARPLAEALEQRGMTLDGFGAQDASARGRGEAAADERRDGRPRTTPRASALAAARATQTLSTTSDGALRL